MSDTDPSSRTTSLAFVHTPTSLCYAVTHVFLPVQPPDQKDYTLENDYLLARAVYVAANAYSAHIRETSERAQWHRITKMLDNLQASVQSEHMDNDHVVSWLHGMRTGDILSFLIRSQNAAITLTKRENCILCEAFEAPPNRHITDGITETLVCSYPQSAVEIPNEVFDNDIFQLKLANFLSRDNGVDSDFYFPLAKHPQYIHILLSRILRSVTRATDVPCVTERVPLLNRLDSTPDIPRITKRIHDYTGRFAVVHEGYEEAWHRSPLWLLIRVTIQMSVHQSLGRPFYKRFVLFFMCILAMDTNSTSLSSDLLHFMSSQILRRLRKIGTVPDWLSEMALNTCACIRGILDSRWKQLDIRRSPFQNPSQDELVRDSRLSLLNSREYIRNVLTDHSHESTDASFCPSYGRRGSIDDFLSADGSFFEEAYDADPAATLYDVQRSVEQGIDNWLSHITNVDEACAQLEILMDKYMMKAFRGTKEELNPEDDSARLLTAIELYVALDKLSVKEIPMLADYPPEIPIALLEKLLLRRTTSLHRLSCIYMYLSIRHSQSRPGWSVLSDEFTEDSFPIRYYDQSLRLQQLKACIEEDVLKKAAAEVALQRGRVGQDEHRLAQNAVPRSSAPLPPLLSHVKVVIFELQCPPCIRMWRSAAPRILCYLCRFIGHHPHNTEERHHLLMCIPALQSYLVDHQGPPLHVQVHFACFYSRESQPQNGPTLRYVVRQPDLHTMEDNLVALQEARERYQDWPLSFNMCGHNGLFYFFSHGHWGNYVNYTFHTSNDILSAQVDCPADLSLDEFIAFAHLRSGGFLQWLNILQGLRSRTLNLRRHQVHFLLSHAIFQVGPLDLSTGTWIWHQELQDSSFCSALLDELDNLFIDVGAGSVDAALMGTISLLLTRLLTSSPSETISERIIAFLQKVRRRTFYWMQELSYDLEMAPTNKERRKILRDMAATCRSTFDVDPTMFCKLFHSAEDVDTLLSCAFFIHALPPPNSRDDDPYSLLIYQRDTSLSLYLEGTLREVVLADVSDYGFDLAVGKIFRSYQPGTHTWKPLDYPNNRWLTCKIEDAVDQLRQTMHVNLHTGELRVDGRPLGGLPLEIVNSRECEQIFRDVHICCGFCHRQIFLTRLQQGFFVIPSNANGMEFMTLTTTSKYKVHFSLRGGSLMLQARCHQTKDILVLIPSSKFTGDIPPTLIDEHVHWLNLSTKTIEIRPLDRLWEGSSENWRIDCTSGQYRMYRGHETLVDIGSPTWGMISKCFEWLNNVADGLSAMRPSGDEDLQNLSKNLVITTCPIDSSLIPRLSVTFPRYGLSFFVNEREELESCDFKDMVYDENQSVGTLFGLENLLVLRPKTHLGGTRIPEALIPRRVLIPNGHPMMHVTHRIQIDVGPFLWRHDVPLYHSYEVDTDLGCLIGNGTMASTRFLAYSHAKTSRHRPDPLTGKTGAQAALCLLQSAGCRSLMKLKAFDDSANWTSTQYSQINATHKEFQNRYYWNRDAYERASASTPEKHAAQHIACLSPSNAPRPISPEDEKTDNNSDLTKPRGVLAGPGLPLFPPPVSSLQYVLQEGVPLQITLGQLLSRRPAPELPSRSTLLCDSYNMSSGDISALDQLFSSLRAYTSFQREYLAHLNGSAQCVRMDSRMTRNVAGKNLVEALNNYYAQCRLNFLESLDILKKSLGPTADPHEQAIGLFGQWPPVTVDVLLRCLASTSPIDIPLCWKKCLVLFALCVLDLQRSRRLLRFALNGQEEEFLMELENEACDGWDPEEYPDWLLIQVEGNFLIRRAQAITAMEMISPQSGESTLTQVNMGEGKSSVIIPIVVAALADGNRLVRVVVPKALVVQMFELLVARLGGLANRPVYHLPFARAAEYDLNGKVVSLQIDDLCKFMPQCMAERGILLVQPEHVVSLKLTSVEEQLREWTLTTSPLPKLQKSIYERVIAALSVKSISGDTHVGSMFKLLRQSPNHSSKDTTQTGEHDKHSEGAHSASGSSSKWLSLQKWLHSHVRDILDESDEILHSRFQLVYTTGSQQHVDGYPDRWIITQNILRLVKKHMYFLSRYTPGSIEYECDPPGSFPHVRIVRGTDVDRQLISLITEDVMTGRLPDFKFQNIPSALHNAIRSFISDEDVLQIPDTVKRVEEYARRSERGNLWSGLLLLRGLLASNILLFALTERRWHVDYGLDPQYRLTEDEKHRQAWRLHPLHRNRDPTMLAMPYRAKDVPAPNTNFGHPDLTIVLTCLSYYYTGLTERQLRFCFETLLDEDDPSTEYAHWIQEYDHETLPDSLRKLDEITLKSSEQWDKVVFPLFSRNQAAIDFYLSRVVFPKEAKEFPWKLSGSSWDLAEKRENLITGFSGTNDGRWLLPMSIAQRDLDHEQGTNARVLANLLQPENNFYTVIRENGERQTTLEFLRLVTTQRPEIRVLLDVGAQILDLSNREVAKAWLDIARAAGAIYFNEDDELMMLTPSGNALPMLSSPLSQRLGSCVVYLDHAHTRGTDIKFPIGSRAAVTLGPKVTKDALVQGCMRMRKLGHGHSVMFFAPLEVDLTIRAITGKKDPHNPVTTVDILCWAIHETWTDIRQRAPYWSLQGISHKLRYDTWSRFCNDELTPAQLSDAWLQPEGKSLADLYAPREAKDASSILSELAPEIRQRCKDLGVLSLPSAQMDEMQEREVNREREREREVELPPEAEPAEHILHPDVVSFVKTGIMPPLHSGSAFFPVFTTLEKSSAVIREADVWSPFILATADFCKTIKPDSTQGSIDQYLRPVQWILSRRDRRNHLLVLISPFEAGKLMPDIRASECVHLHIYAPRTSQRMKPSDDLRIYTIPPLPSDWTPPWDLIDQLNVFAGQLYLRDYKSYLRLCGFLGVATKESQNDLAPPRNVFKIPGSFEETEITFSGSPLPSVMALLAIRTRGRPFAHTHMGKVLQGQVLREKDFQVPGQRD